MSADKGATVVVYHDLESVCGVHRPVPAGDKEPDRTPMDGEATEAMDVECAYSNVHPHPNGARAPLDNLSNATIETSSMRSTKVPADEPGVPDAVDNGVQELQPAPTAADAGRVARWGIMGTYDCTGFSVDASLSLRSSHQEKTPAVAARTLLTRWSRRLPTPRTQ